MTAFKPQDVLNYQTDFNASVFLILPEAVSSEVFTQLHHDCHLADSDCKTSLYNMHLDVTEVKRYQMYV